MLPLAIAAPLAVVQFTSPLPIWIAHLCALILVGALMLAGLAPRLALVAMMILALRAGLGFWRLRITPKQLGFSEIGFGALTLLAVVFGQLFAL
jgi:hypothetical protein